MWWTVLRWQGQTNSSTLAILAILRTRSMLIFYNIESVMKLKTWDKDLVTYIQLHHLIKSKVAICAYSSTTMSSVLFCDLILEFTIAISILQAFQCRNSLLSELLVLNVSKMIGTNSIFFHDVWKCWLKIPS